MSYQSGHPLEGVHPRVLLEILDHIAGSEIVTVHNLAARVAVNESLIGQICASLAELRIVQWSSEEQIELTRLGRSEIASLFAALGTIRGNGAFDQPTSIAYTAAVSKLRSVLTAAEEIGTGSLTDVLRLLEVAVEQERDTSTLLEHVLLTRAKSSESVDVRCGLVYWTMGTVHNLSGDVDQARAAFAVAVQHFERAERPDLVHNIRMVTGALTARPVDRSKMFIRVPIEYTKNATAGPSSGTGAPHILAAIRKGRKRRHISRWEIIRSRGEFDLLDEITTAGATAFGRIAGFIEGLPKADDDV